MAAPIWRYEVYEVKAMFEHPHHPYLRGNIDRFYRRHGEQAPLGFLECKTTSEFNSGWECDNIPIHYKIQLATYMSILNMEVCQIACLKLPESLRWVAGILYQMKRVFGKLPVNVMGDIRDRLNALNDSAIKPFIPMVLSVIGGEFLMRKLKSSGRNMLKSICRLLWRMKQAPTHWLR